MPQRTLLLLFLFLSIALCSLLVLPTSSFADPGPIGPEFPADDRALPAANWHTSCVDDAGVSSTLEREPEDCSTGECVAGDELLLVRRSQSGAPLGDALSIGDEPVAFAGFRLSCLSSGSAVAQWQDATSRCYMHRVLDAAGNPVHSPRRTVPEGSVCTNRPNITLARNGAFFAIWEEQSTRSAIRLQRFSASGSPVGEMLTIADDLDRLASKPKLAVDELGFAVLVYQTAASSNTPAPIYARFLDASKQPIGDAFRVNTFAHGAAKDPAVVSEGGGDFVVLWSNLLQGGRVGRRVNIVGTFVYAETTTTTTMPRPENMPLFGAAQIVDSTMAAQPELTENRVLPSDTAQWLLHQSDDRVRSSTDDGKNWSDRAPVIDRSEGRLETIGTDGAGAWIGLVGGLSIHDVSYMRSADRGATWTKAHALGATSKWSPDCNGCSMSESAIAGSPGGTWVAAWSYENLVEDSQTGEQSWREAIGVVRATKGGVSWKRFEDVAIKKGLGHYGFELATDGSGAWVLMWADEDLWFVNSRDDGATWSAPRRLARDIVCTTCPLHDRYRRISASGDAVGNWVAAFATPLLAPEHWGHDADVFVMRSVDAGASWSAPSPLLPDSATDGSRDLFPSVATDRTGRWLVSFTSYRPRRGPDDMDADVFAALSTDNGFSWSRAVAVNEDAAGDAVGDLAPTLTADDRGVWMAAWRALSFEPEGDIVAERVHLATADAECGNSRIDPAEQCDDGNRDNDDGCDSNCTVSACGNGIPTADEECDDANDDEEDHCLAECRVPFCGDGVIAPGSEQCDDGNTITTDECTLDCERARCGDGYVQEGVEQCDDGNGNSFDGCTNRCELPYCGDGIIAAHEECDDANDTNDDWCVDDCRDAECGDGHVNRYAERCDFGDPKQADICDMNCGVPETCGDADGNGQVTSGDVHRILGNGVGLDVVCPRSTCDVDGSGMVTAGDAQMGLAMAVGLEADDDCVIGAAQVTFFVKSDEKIGALQIGAHYGLTGGAFVGLHDLVDCVGLVPGTITTFNNDDRFRTLHIAMIALHSLQAPANVASCRFNIPLDAPRPQFELRVVDASGPDFQTIAPEIGYRVSGDVCTDDCDEAQCSDGFVDPGEQCDDGNESNEDACTNTCVFATCGDGYVEKGVEECDEGSQNGGASCTNACRVGECGDGFIAPGEACDDGNGSNADFCLNDCSIARCGDGFVNPFTERCDPAASASDVLCEPDCHITDDCEDDGSECPIGGRWIVFTVGGPQRLGALQFEVGYADSDVRFFGRDANVLCVPLVDGVIATFNDDQSVDTLHAGLITLGGFSTPRDVVACRVDLSDGAPLPQYDVKVVDASDHQLDRVFPFPTVTYRLVSYP